MTSVARVLRTPPREEGVSFRRPHGLRTGDLLAEGALVTGHVRELPPLLELRGNGRPLDL